MKSEVGRMGRERLKVKGQRRKVKGQRTKDKGEGTKVKIFYCILYYFKKPFVLMRTAKHSGSSNIFWDIFDIHPENPKSLKSLN